MPRPSRCPAPPREAPPARAAAPRAAANRRRPASGALGLARGPPAPARCSLTPSPQPLPSLRPPIGEAARRGGGGRAAAGFRAGGARRAGAGGARSEAGGRGPGRAGARQWEPPEAPSDRRVLESPKWERGADSPTPRSGLAAGGMLSLLDLAGRCPARGQRGHRLPSLPRVTPTGSGWWSAGGSDGPRAGTVRELGAWPAPVCPNRTPLCGADWVWSRVRGSVSRAGSVRLRGGCSASLTWRGAAGPLSVPSHPHPSGLGVGLTGLAVVAGGSPAGARGTLRTRGSAGRR